MEEIAGILAGGGALLVGHAIVVHGHQHLHVANQLDDGEDTDGDHHQLAVGAIHKVAAVPPAEVGGNAPAVTAIVAAAITAIHQPPVQHHRLRHLHTAAGHIAGGHLLTVVGVGDILAVEYPHVPLATVENHLFAEYAHTVEGGAGTAVSAVHLHLHVEEKGQIAGIIAAVKGQRLHVDVGGDDLRLFGADTAGVVHQHLLPLGEEQPHILDAVLVTAAVVHPPRIYADRFFASAVTDIFFRHTHSLLYRIVSVDGVPRRRCFTITVCRGAWTCE